MDKSIFRAYDIRGIYGQDMDEADAAVIGNAIFEYAKPKRVAVGHDARLSAPAVHESLCRGLAGCGAEVVNLGMVSTDMTVFASGALDFDMAISVTASHNPKEWIGMKLHARGGVPIGGEGEIVAIGDIALGLDPTKVRMGDAPIVTIDIMSDWLDHVMRFVPEGGIRPMKIVVDAGNGVAGPMVRSLAERLPVTIIEMYFEPDGNFPNHLPSPIEPENTVDLRARVVAEGADLGMAFDGDADRVFLVDEKGQLVTGSEMTALAIDAALGDDPARTVLYNAICGWNVRDVLAKYPQATSYRTKVGHAFIKKDMRTYDAYFAGEHSGHYFFRDNFFADSGLIASMVVLGLISKDGRPLSEILAVHRKYVQIPETNFKVTDVRGVTQALADTYSDGQIDWLDGLTVSYPNFWFNVRPSSNEPLLRLNVEAESQELLDEKFAELSGKISQLGQASA